MNNMDQALAREVIRDRTTSRGAVARPTHPRMGRALRRIANRLDPH